MNKEYKYIAVLGAGESGVGAALLAKKNGQKVFVSDRWNNKGQIQKGIDRKRN